ncbi:MAG: hypothetical protein ACHP84_15280 [Caulobacterales bacterium]
MSEQERAPPDPRSRDFASAAFRVLLAAAAIAMLFAVSGQAHGPGEVVIWLFEALTGATFGLLAARFLVPVSWYRGRSAASGPAHRRRGHRARDARRARGAALL